MSGELQIMAEIRDITPLKPVWPRRSSDKPAKQKQQESEKNKKKPDENDDGKPHIDEYI